MPEERFSPDVKNAYNRWAASYDEDKNATRDLDSTIVRRAPLNLRGQEVLELGCGTGKNTTFFAELAEHVVAIDFSEGMIARAHQHVAASNVNVDVVVGNLILEHVHDLAPVYFEAARVLRPGGQFFICELHPYRQLLGVQAHFVDSNTGETVKVTAHVHTASEYVNGGIEAGFQLRAFGEWTEEDAAADAPPRLISLLFDRV